MLCFELRMDKLNIAIIGFCFPTLLRTFSHLSALQRMYREVIVNMWILII
jgi:hypothetical protein